MTCFKRGTDQPDKMVGLIFTAKFKAKKTLAEEMKRAIPLMKS